MQFYEWGYLCIGILIFFLTSVHGSELDFTVEVEAGRIQCFFQPVLEPRHVTMEVDYQVIDGGDLDINFIMSNPQGAVLVQDVRKQDGSHRLDVSMKGDYQLCFDNTFSYQNYKLVFFEVFLTDKDGVSDDVKADAFAGAAPFTADIGITMEAFKDSAQKIKTNLNRAEHMQALLRAYEARDRAIMEANLDRVSFWSILNAVILVLVGFTQVFMIRQLFEETSRIGKLMRRN